MGATISTRAEWQSAPPPAGSESTNLTKNIRNQELLYELLSLVELIAKNYPAEAAASFKKPLAWTTPTLRASHFTQFGKEFTVTGVGAGRAAITSVAVNHEGKALFSLEQGTDKTYFAKAYTMEYLNKALVAAGDAKLRELEEILQANRDPLAVISGQSGDSASTLIDVIECANDASGNEKIFLSKLTKLLVVINNLDLQIMSGTLRTLEKKVVTSIEQVSAELSLLQNFCGNDPKNCLVSIDWESDVVFANGLRALPWRQVFGELAYIEIQPMDREKFLVTASRNGYFVNKGHHTDEKGEEKITYDKEGEVFPSLISLLKATSAHFAATIDKQEYLYKSEIKDAIAEPVKAAVEASKSAVQREVEEEVVDDAQGEAANEVDIAAAKADASKKINRKRKGQSKATNKGGPSLKWKALGFAFEDNSRAQEERKATRTVKKHDVAAEVEAEAAELSRHHTLVHHEHIEGSDEESEASSEEEIVEKRQDNAESPPEFWNISKLVKYLKVGNQTATIIAICSFHDVNLTSETSQLAIRDTGGLEILVNLLETNDSKCKIGALQILKVISKNNVQIRKAIANLDGMQPLVALLKGSDPEIKCLAAETIAHCAKNPKNCRAVRHFGGIKRLVGLLKYGQKKADPAHAGSVNLEHVARSGALALWTCSKSLVNKKAIKQTGAIRLLAKLLESKNEELLIPVVGILQECASDVQYRMAIRTSGMVKFLVENLSSKSQELQTHCASAIFKCAEDDETRVLVRTYNGLEPLVNLLSSVNNKELMIAVTGAVWKAAQNLDNVAAFNQLNTIKKLVGLMGSQPEEVLVNVVGALGACAQTEEGRTAIRTGGGITPIVSLLTGTNQALLVNVTTAVGACAKDPESMVSIDKQDGVRLLWSLLKSPNPDVQASAAWAICPCIESAKDAGEMVRSFVGGLELIVSLLKSENTEVLASVCAAISNIAKDDQNLAVITDHIAIPMLAKLTTTKSDRLRKHLAEAIARCCTYRDNRVSFGEANAVAPLVKYLKSSDIEVHRATARALHQLSLDANNCITMHEHGVVHLLLGMVGSDDGELQEAAAGCISNIRRLALDNERAALTSNAAAHKMAA